MSNDTLLREVDEELRSDRMRRLWRVSAPYVIGAAVGVVLLVAGYEGWNWYHSGNASRSSDQFYAATAIADGTDFDAARKALDEVIAQGSGAYPALAQFREAALLAANDRTAEAVAAYDALATSLSDTRLRELALVMAGHLLVDGGDVAAVEQRVGGSIVPESPLRNAAREVLGLVQYKAGQFDASLASFQAIIDDPVAGRDLVGRVQIYIQQLLAEGATPAVTEANVAEQATPAEATVAVDASTELDVTPSAEAPSVAP